MTKPYPFTDEGVTKFRSDALDEIMRLIDEATPTIISVNVGDCQIEIPAYPETFEAMEDFVIESRRLLDEIEAEDAEGGEQP